MFGTLDDLCENSGTLQQTQFMMDAFEQEIHLYKEIAMKRLILSISSEKQEGTLSGLQKELNALDLLSLDEWE